MASRLDAFLLSLPEANRAAVRKAVQAVVDDADAFLWNWPGPIGLEKPEPYLEAMRDHLMIRYPWLTPEAWQRLRSFNLYMIWHEGL